MFDTLSEKLTTLFQTIRKKSTLTANDVESIMVDIRLALLDADVALTVVDTVVNTIKSDAVGQAIIRSINPTQMVIKIVYDHLVGLFGPKIPLNMASKPPIVMMMVGLQGSGKTTSTAKLGLYLQKTMGKKVILVSLDVYRPAAQHQLEILGETTDLLTLPSIPGENPTQIWERAKKFCTTHMGEVIVLDTAGRLHIDEVMMQELKTIKKLSNPSETFFVADAMTGQSAAEMALSFHKSIDVTGIILTRVDADGRGGAALSMSHLTGKPIQFLGVGEKTTDFEIFDAKRVADRILDQGDVVALAQKAQDLMAEQDLEKWTKKIEKGQFTLRDYEKQLLKMVKMGGVSEILSLLPGMKQMKNQLSATQMDDTVIKRYIAIIRSMTLKERKHPTLLNGSRRKRIALGSGVDVQMVNKLMKQFETMQKMMRQMKKGGIGALSQLFGGGGKMPF